jgi:hypothetical protein
VRWPVVDHVAAGTDRKVQAADCTANKLAVAPKALGVTGAKKKLPMTAASHKRDSQVDRS